MSIQHYVTLTPAGLLSLLTATLGLVTVLTLTAVYAGTEPTVTGFAEFRGHFRRSAQRSQYHLVQLVRTDFRAPLTDRLLLAATVEAGLTRQRTLQPQTATTIRTTSDDYLDLERLFIDAYLPAIDLRLGRQAINWGSAFLVNPTDPYPELLLLEPWRSRQGVNAVRATVRLGHDHQLQTVLATDHDFRYSNAATRATFRIGPADLSIVGAWKEESRRGLAGVDLRGTAVVGYWLEGALHLAGADVYEEVAIGLDYSFAVLDNLVLTVQYYRNNAAAFDAGGPAPRPAQGRDYGMLSMALNLNPEWAFSALWICNLSDRAALLVPAIRFTPGRRLELSAAAHLRRRGSGDNTGEHQIRRPDSVPENTFIGWIRLNF